jgi:hypothetical protein
MFVTPQDFLDQPYNLPKMNDADVQSVFQRYINKKEATELRRVLGSDFYEAFAAAMNALPALWVKTTNYIIGNQVLYGYDVFIALVNNANVLPVDGATWQLQPRTKWQKLWAGESYANADGVKQNWAGMSELMKPFIYAFWLRDYITTSVQDSGVIQQTTENAAGYSSSPRFSEAFMNYSRMVGKRKTFLGAQDRSTIGLIGSQDRNTLYEYLFAKAADFNDVVAAITSLNGDFLNYLSLYFQNPGIVNEFDL